MSASRAKGTAWETAIVTYLRTRGWPHAERRTLAGRLDRGDINGVIGLVVETKNAKAVTLAAWLDEAKREAAVLEDKGVVWFKRRGKTSPGDGFVLMDGATFTELLIEAGYQ